MRPVRLTLAGFTAFREPVTVEFDADLFALVGPTGSGKTSIIDGICFALYGSVPRLDRRTVEPVISAGKLEARVRLDFAIGEQEYTAARVVRRMTRGGASTKEARLERGDEVLASEADPVTAEVERVLGLNFEQFTKCVVLPQGEFARFLHDTPKGRQELLVRLLELEVYRGMRQVAHGRHSASAGRVELFDAQLEELSATTDQALSDAERRIAALEALHQQLEAVQPRLDELARARGEAERLRDETTGRIALLEALTAPGDLSDLAGESTRASEALDEARAQREKAEAGVEDAEQACAELGDPAEAQRLLGLHDEHERQQARADQGTPLVAQARADEQAAAGALASAGDGVRRAETELAELRDRHAAHALAATLVAGQPCPVCEQPVTSVTRRKAPSDLAQAQQSLDETRAAQRAADEQHRLAAQRRAKAEQTLDDITAALAELRGRLDRQPGKPAVRQRLADITAAQQELRDAREAARAARDTERERTATLERARDGVAQAWQGFDAARDRVAVLSPPPASRADLGGSWEQLIAWAREQAQVQRRSAQQAEHDAAAAASDYTTLTGQVAKRCEDGGIGLAGQAPRDACVAALATARAQRDRVAADLERAARLRGERAEQADHAAVAKALAGHLSAAGFERWLLDEALQRLATGASSILRELTGAQYSLQVDDQRNFAVIDHRNADERRPARTLSGGETFLASVALALTLGEHIANLALAGRPALESIFLDEGFGTLDQATLDVVASAVEELGSKGRTVGVITHVRELAERIPVRYEVRKSPGGSSIERVVA